MNDEQAIDFDREIEAARYPDEGQPAAPRRMDGVVYTRLDKAKGFDGGATSALKTGGRYVIGPDGREWDWPLNLADLLTWSTRINDMRAVIRSLDTTIGVAVRDGFREHEAVDNQLGDLISAAIETPGAAYSTDGGTTTETVFDYLMRHISEGPSLGTYRLSRTVMLRVLRELKKAREKPATIIDRGVPTDESSTLDVAIFEAVGRKGLSDIQVLISHMKRQPAATAWYLSAEVIERTLQALLDAWTKIAATPSPTPPATSAKVDEPIKLGDVVRLRGTAGPLMTVERIGTSDALTVWFTIDHRLKRYRFPIELLIKAERQGDE